jgi:hypothetical protein
MDCPKIMDVVDWQESPLPVVVKKRAPQRFLSPTLIGILGTLLLHALVIQSVPFGGKGAKAKPPENQQLTDALSRSKADSSESLVLLSLASGKPSDMVIQIVAASLPDLSQLKIKPAVHVETPELRNIETLALSEDSASSSATQSDDAEEKARLFGIYNGQIQARIARVWRRPRTPVNESAVDQKPADTDGSFQCEAQIVQDVRGNVQEILLPRCNGSAAWQRSLVLAIQQASPLPAPPSTKVFTQSITLNFIGLPYIQGASNEEYEIMPLAGVN